MCVCVSGERNFTFDSIFVLFFPFIHSLAIRNMFSVGFAGIRNICKTHEKTVNEERSVYKSVDEDGKGINTRTP